MLCCFSADYVMFFSADYLMLFFHFLSYVVHHHALCRDAGLLGATLSSMYLAPGVLGMQNTSRTCRLLE